LKQSARDTLASKEWGGALLPERAGPFAACRLLPHVSGTDVPPVFDLDIAIQRICKANADDPAILPLTGIYHNLLRRWSETCFLADREQCRIRVMNGLQRDVRRESGFHS
jgi:hypothetical protein